MKNNILLVSLSFLFLIKNKQLLVFLMRTVHALKDQNSWWN